MARWGRSRPIPATIKRRLGVAPPPPLSEPYGLATIDPSSSPAGTAGATFTPRANSRIFVAALATNTGSTAVMSIADTGGRTWTLETSSTSLSGNDQVRVWSALAGASPSATTITLTMSSGTAYIGAGAIDVDPALAVRAASNVQGSGAPTVSGTLPSPTASGNTVLAFFAQVHPTTDMDVPTPSGFTLIRKSTGSTFLNIIPTNWSYSTTFAATSATTTNGDTSYVSAGALIELGPVGGATAFSGWGFIPI